MASFPGKREPALELTDGTSINSVALLRHVQLMPFSAVIETALAGDSWGMLPKERTKMFEKSLMRTATMSKRLMMQGQAEGTGYVYPAWQKK